MMRAAIATDGRQVAEHFGRCPGFTVVEFAGGKAINRKGVPNPGPHDHELLAAAMVGEAVSLVVWFGARDAIEAHGIEVVAGVSGTVDETIERIASGTLEAGEATCDHAGHGRDVEGPLGGGHHCR